MVMGVHVDGIADINTGCLIILAATCLFRIYLAKDFNNLDLLERKFASIRDRSFG